MIPHFGARLAVYRRAPADDNAAVSVDPGESGAVAARGPLLALGSLGVGAALLVIASAPSRLLAAEFAVGLLAANIAFAWVEELPPRSRWITQGAVVVANLVAITAACRVLGAGSHAWILAMIPALLAPRRALGGPRRAVLYVVALAAAAALGCWMVGLSPLRIGVASFAIAAVGVAPWLSIGALELRDELSWSQTALDQQRAALAAAEVSSLRLRARLRDDKALRQTHAELTASFERRFAAVEARHEEILGAIVDAVLTVDPRGTITSSNPACEELLRAHREQIVGWPLTRFLPRATTKLLGVIYGNGRADEDTEQMQRTREFLCMRDDGSSVEVELGVGSFGGAEAGEDDADAVFTLVLRDISARKRVERMKDELVSTVSHELRTPLTAIIGSIGLLNGGASGPLPEQASRLLEVAERNGQRLLTLIEDILDIQKMEAGKLDFDMQPSDLAGVVARAVETNRPLGQAKGVDFEFVADDELPEAWIDPGRIEQVVTNLVSNASKHAPKDTKIEVRVDLAAPGRLRVQVRDHGPGLEESMMDRVFERFEQGDMGDTRPSGGTGLGLAIARAIVQRHGGEIGVESELGSGANFYFELPTAAALGRAAS